MCNNSLIYLSTPTVSSVATDALLPFSTIVRRRGSSIQQSNNSIVLGACGYYRVSISATFSATTPGDVTIELRQDNLPIVGGTATTTITTATTEIRSISYDVIVRVPCGAVPSVITAVNVGVPISASNIIINAEYLD